MYGRVDRGGSREGKKSLRKNKASRFLSSPSFRFSQCVHLPVQVVLHAAKTKPEQFIPKVAEQSTTSAPPPVRVLGLAGSSAPPRISDALCNLVSRKLNDELERVVQRATQSGVEALFVHSPDADKQEALLELTGQFPAGSVYAIVGVHPDNTKKTADVRAIVQRVAALRPLALRAETVAILGGLAVSARDVSGHFPQERLLAASLELAADVRLPCVLACSGGALMAEKVALAVRENPGVGRIALVHFGGSTDDYRIVQRLEQDPPGAASSSGAGGKAGGGEAAKQEEGDGDDDEEDENNDDYDEGDEDGSAHRSVQVFLVVTGALCDASELGKAEQELVRATPLDRLLLATDSPNYTPQNITDAWIKEVPNDVISFCIVR